MLGGANLEMKKLLPMCSWDHFKSVVMRLHSLSALNKLTSAALINYFLSSADFLYSPLILSSQLLNFDCLCVVFINLQYYKLYTI